MSPSEIVKSKISRLVLEDFRNYPYLDFSPTSDFVVITGPNGAGKTNLLEAISMMTPGKGLRGSNISEMMTLGCDSQDWKVTCDCVCKYGVSRIIASSIRDRDSIKKNIVIDDSVVNQSELPTYLNINWLVPQMGHIFIDSSSSRRKFMDRMVMHFDKQHSKNLSSYDYYVKERMNLLKSSSYDEDWITVLERNIAQYGILIAISRVEFVEKLKNTAKDMRYDLPKFDIKVAGDIENNVYDAPSVKLEEDFKAILKKNRALDAISKRTNAGIHRSDLLVWKGETGVKADMCSTGEQKFLLMSVFLTEILAQLRYNSTLPIILLDDAVAHLDTKSQAIFFEIVSDIGAQVWVTSTFMENFKFLKNRAEFLRVENSNLLLCENE